jgi:hypothetical protein
MSDLDDIPVASTRSTSAMLVKAIIGVAVMVALAALITLMSWPKLDREKRTAEAPDVANHRQQPIPH